MKDRIIKISSLVILFLLTAILQSYAQTEEWRVTYDSSIGAPPNLYPAQDIGREIGFDAAGNVYVAVASIAWLDRMSDNPKTFSIFKFDTDGNELWNYTSDPGRNSDSLSDFHVDSQGNVYGAYATYYYYYYSPDNYGGGKTDAHIFKLNNDGTLAWHNEWNNSAVNGNDYPTALDVDTNGNVYFLINSDISSPGSSPNYDAVVLKYSPTGNILWEIGDSSDAIDIDVDNNGNVHMLQRQGGEVKKYASADGGLLCSAVVRYWWDDDGLPDNPTYWADVPGEDIKVAPDGTFYVTGTAEQRHWFWVGPGNNDWDSELHDNFFTAKYGSDCSQIWSDEYGSYEADDQPKELVFDDAGNILVTGPSGYRLATLKYSPNGTRVGTYRYSDNDASGFHIDGDYAYVIETNFSSPYRSLHRYLLSSGAEHWNLSLNSLRTANDVNIFTSGSFYLTGSVHDGELHNGPSENYADDMILIKYSQLGDFDNDGDIDGSDLAVFAVGGTGITLEEFSTDFGKTNCP